VPRGKSVTLPNIMITCAILASLLPLSREALASAEPKRVLLLYGNDHGLPAHELTDKAFRSAMKANPDFSIQIFSEFLDLSRFQGF
jgi:hypothetical protein